MAQIKAHEFDGLIKKSSAPPYRAFLIYGQDPGLIAERGQQLSKKLNIDQTDEFNLIKLDYTEILSDPGRLVDEVNAIALFGGNRLIWIRSAGNDKKFTSAVQASLEDINQDTTIIIEAGDLKKTAGLRKLAEKNSVSLAIPCYADNDRSLQALIDEELNANELRIDISARQMLLSFLGGDRRASRAEIQKLALYCAGNELITEEDVLAAVGDASSVSVDEAVDAILSGNINGLDKSYNRIISSKTPIFLVLRSCLIQFQQLELMRNEIEKNNKRPSQVMSEMGRFIHFKRKPAFEKALGKWSAKKLRAELNRISKTILDTRQNASMEESLARQTLMRLCLLSR